MYSIALANLKGGTGKSSTTIHLAVAAAQAGYAVAIVDTDEQRSIASWASLRESETPFVTEASARELPHVLRTLRRDAKFCLVDCAGHDWRSLAAAVASVDLTIVVGRPSLLDIDVSMRVRDLLQRHGLAHAFLLSQVPPQHGLRYAEWSASYKGLGTVISPPLSHRVAFQDAIAYGLGVTEYSPGSKAAQEIEGVFAWILKHRRRRA